MYTLSIAAAAKLFKKSRNTIREHLRTGKLSYSQNGTTIDFSELLRVYGPAPNQPNGAAQTTLLDQPDQPSNKDIELAVAREKISGLEALLEEREKRILLLTNTQKSWFKRFFS